MSDSADAATATGTTHLSVMSYNVRFDNPPVDPFTWSERRDDVAGVIRFHDPDIVGLQEALHSQLADLRERLPGYEWLSAGRAEERNAGEYAAVGYDAERFEAVADSTFWLSENPHDAGSVGWDARFPRLVRWVRLRERATGTELVHFNTHFDHEGETARLRSADLLRERIEERVPGTPVIVTGDLNCVESEAPYRQLLDDERAADGDASINGDGKDDDDTGGDTPANRVLYNSQHASDASHHGPLTTKTDFDGLVPGKKIDHVLVSDDVAVRGHGICADTTADGRYPSDHLPIVADLTLPRADHVAATPVATDVASPNAE